MKTAIGLVLVFALALSAVPAVAGDTFHALRTLPTTDQTGLIPLSDDQLAAIEGQYFRVDIDVDTDIYQFQSVRQTNSVKYGDYNYQENSAYVVQSANVTNIVASKVKF
jgi:hypothetical protein